MGGGEGAQGELDDDLFGGGGSKNESIVYEKKRKRDDSADNDPLAFMQKAKQEKQETAMRKEMIEK